MWGTFGRACSCWWWGWRSCSAASASPALTAACGRDGERLDKLREYASLLVGVGWAAVGVLVLLGVVRFA